MEVSMLRLAWLPIAQHVFQPALTGRLELISRKIVSSEQEQRLSRCADFAQKCLPRIECKELPRFREKYRALGRHVCKIREIGGQKMGSNMRPRYIQFRDIHDRDISGLHCIRGLTVWENWWRYVWQSYFCCMYLLWISFIFSFFRFFLIHITHWGRDKMADISQTTFSNTFSWMKTYEFRLLFHWILFLRVKLTISYHIIGSDNGLEPTRR